jgi:ribosomal protein S18 acetylase RimI-like enzyme
MGPPSAPTPDARPAVTLREFRLTDIPFIASIVAEALHEHYDPSLYGSLSTEWPTGFLVTADATEVPVGFLLGVNQVEGEARILMFAVERRQRMQGVGTLLMTTFLDRCRARGFRRVTLEVRVSNATAIRFYSHYQFSVVDLLRSYYSDGENGYQMARDLP